MGVIESEAGTWTERPNPVRGLWEQTMEGEAPRAYTCGPLSALVGRERAGGGEPRWHVSLSCENRLPSWDELVDAAHALRPGVPFALAIPPRSWWINIHPYVLHLWEVRDDRLVEQWRMERRGDRPT